MVERYRSSGLSVEQFVAGEGISHFTLKKWVERERAAARAAAQPVRFQEVKLPSSPKPWAVEIVTPQNWMVRFASVPDAAGLQGLLRVLPC
jgi:hypothetical protein